MNEDAADAFLNKAMTMLRPLIDDLAMRIGESPEAWRGVTIIVNGISGIMMNLMDAVDDGDKQVVVLSIILAAIDCHPAKLAAERHWELP